MILTEEQMKEFKKVSEPVIKWLCEHDYPHLTVIIDQTSSELVEGVSRIKTDKFVKD